MTTAIFSLSALGISIAENVHALGLSVGGMSIFVVAIYATAVRSIFRVDAAFRVYRKIFTVVQNHTIKTYALGQEIAAKSIDQLTDKQIEKRNTNLEILVIANRFFLFSARKMKEYSSSNLSLVSGVVVSIWLIVLCVTAFAFITLGLSKIDQTQFSPPVVPTAFTLIYYSFKTFISNSVNDFTSIKRASETYSIVENAFGIFTLSIFIGLMLNQKNKRQFEEIHGAVRSIEADAGAFEIL